MPCIAYSGLTLQSDSRYTNGSGWQVLYHLAMMHQSEYALLVAQISTLATCFAAYYRLRTYSSDRFTSELCAAIGSAISHRVDGDMSIIFPDNWPVGVMQCDMWSFSETHFSTHAHASGCFECRLGSGMPGSTHEEVGDESVFWQVALVSCLP